LLPVACALGADAAFTGSGRLPQRPLSPLYEQLEAHGVCLSPQGQMPLTIRGTLGTQTPFVLAGDVSSQYISGLLMALPLCGGEIVLTTPLESKPYVQMTLDTLRRFGVQAEQTASGWRVRRGRALCAPGAHCGAGGLVQRGVLALRGGDCRPGDGVRPGSGQPAGGSGDRCLFAADGPQVRGTATA
jgi:3-phosphoshikimate 1-carboxyvinyltransferase